MRAGMLAYFKRFFIFFIFFYDSITIAFLLQSQVAQAHYESREKHYPT